MLNFPTQSRPTASVNTIQANISLQINTAFAGWIWYTSKRKKSQNPANTQNWTFGTCKIAKIEKIEKSWNTCRFFSHKVPLLRVWGRNMHEKAPKSISARLTSFLPILAFLAIFSKNTSQKSENWTFDGCNFAKTEKIEKSSNTGRINLPKVHFLQI